MKKKINILLIIVVVGLWGTVGYRYVNNYFFPEVPVNPLTNKSLAIKNLSIERDTFDLKPLARDPFLNRNVAVSPSGTPRSFNSKGRGTGVVNTKPKVVPVPVEWPEIYYYGYIKSGKNQELVIVKINGKISRMHRGQVRNGLLVKNIFKDSIMVVFNKQQRVIRSAN